MFCFFLIHDIVGSLNASGVSPFTWFSVAQNVRIIANFAEDLLRRRKWDEWCCCHTIVSIHSIEHQHKGTSRWIDCRWESTTSNGIRAHALFNWLQSNSDVYRRIIYSLIFGCQNHWQQSKSRRLKNEFLHFNFFLNMQSNWMKLNWCVRCRRNGLLCLPPTNAQSKLKMDIVLKCFFSLLFRSAYFIMKQKCTQ